MTWITDILTMLAAVAIFLLDVQFLVNGLQQGAGKSFKLFLKNKSFQSQRQYQAVPLQQGYCKTAIISESYAAIIQGFH